MGERTEYTPGTFCWTDLSTTDQDAAKKFYGALFDWEAVDNPIGDDMTYSMMRADGHEVAGIATQPAQQREAGVPPAWQSYISVQSADQTLARARELGATVHADAFDVFDVGRMGVIQDPQGAFVLAWQPKQHFGASLVNAPGALCWNELATTDMDGAAGFYSELFGWKTQAMDAGGMPYLVISTADGHSNGGIRPVMPPGTPPHWLVYFGTDEIGAGLARVGELGGTVLAGAMEIAPGIKIGISQDPQGAVFALYAGRFDP